MRWSVGLRQAAFLGAQYFDVDHLPRLVLDQLEDFDGTAGLVDRVPFKKCVDRRKVVGVHEEIANDMVASRTWRASLAADYSFADRASSVKASALSQTCEVSVPCVSTFRRGGVVVHQEHESRHGRILSGSAHLS
jgi:hypothetical protein